MWFWLISAIAKSHIGVMQLKVGSQRLSLVYGFIRKVNQIYLSYARGKKTKYKDIRERRKVEKKYPNVDTSNKIDTLEKRVKYLEEIHMNDGK